MRWWHRRRASHEIAPEDIFLDTASSGTFDTASFEGRLEQPLSERTFVWYRALLVLVVVVLVVRAGYLQVVQGSVLARRSAQNSLESTELFAPRGVITDRHGVPLVRNVEAPNGSMTREYLIPSMGQIIGYISHPKRDRKGNFFDLEQRGLAGIELQYDERLRGINGRVLVERDALGQVHSSGTIVPARQGAALALSIDASLQRHLADAIAEVASDKGFIAGSGVVLDVHTGEVLSIVSYPSYDPNVMSRGGPAEVIASYHESEGHPFLDHAVQGVYAPGSIVKPFLAAGALMDGVVTRDTVINDPGSISLDDPYNPGKRYVFRGWKPLGPMTVESAIAWSSDIYYYTISGGYGPIKGMGIERLAKWYRYFGFGTTTGIDLPDEVPGRVPTPAWKERVLGEPWYLADTYFTSIGQYATQVTPLQAARATAVVVNGGKVLTPTMLRTEPGVEPQVQSVVPVTPEVMRIVQSGMRMTVTEALAQRLNVPYVTVAGKTGTAETGTRNQFDNSWIVGYFPYERPRYAFAVVLERGPAGSGSQAVNAMRSFLDRLHSERSPYLSTTPGTGTETVR